MIGGKASRLPPLVVGGAAMGGGGEVKIIVKSEE